VAAAGEFGTTRDNEIAYLGDEPREMAFAIAHQNALEERREARISLQRLKR
jgi:hypothetical protein